MLDIHKYVKGYLSDYDCFIVIDAWGWNICPALHYKNRLKRGEHKVDDITTDHNDHHLITLTITHFL